jgi:hypothetical protein
MSNAKNLAEEGILLSDPATWVAMDQHREYTVTSRAGDVSPLNGVTVQIRKATSAAGANATDVGSPVTADDQVIVSAFSADLGEFSAGVPFTHFSATVTDQDSPNSHITNAVRRGARFNP